MLSELLYNEFSYYISWTAKVAVRNGTALMS